MLAITRRHITAAVYVFIISCTFLDLGGRAVKGEPALVIESDPFVLQLFDTPKNFAEAKSFCESKSSWLVEVKTSKVLEDLKQLTRSYSRLFWVGGYTSESAWRWTDNTPITTDSPAYTADRCLVLNTDRTLIPGLCDSKLYFVCQAAITTTFFFRGFEYRVSPNTVAGFEAAKSLCSAWDEVAHLADMKSMEIDDALSAELTRRFETSSIYTGGNDITNEGTWVWTDGTTFSGHSNWKKWTWMNEPNGGRQENCLLKAVQYRWEWLDVTCEAQAKASCQKEIYNNRCSSDLCSNRGQCGATPILQGMRFNCSCNDYLIGRMCEIDPCSPNPCQNLGTCAGQHDPPYFLCSCSPEFQGQTCEERVFKNSGDCSYHIYLQRPTSHRQAMSNCSAIDSTFAILSDQNNRDFISNWIKESFAGSANSGEIWVGGTKTSNGWVWLDGTRMRFPGGSNPPADHECASGSVGESLTISTNDCGSSLGFVCEKSADKSSCSTQRCQNGGTCQDVGCHYKCECPAGYEGFTCSEDLLAVTPRLNKITIDKNQRANVTLDIISRVGSLMVRISSILGETQVSNVPSGQHSFLVGPFTSPNLGTRVTFFLFPPSNAFSRSTTVNIVVLDLPHVSISLESAAIGYGRYIYCSATGTPKPTLSWYKAGKKVLESNNTRMLHQLSYNDSQVLVVDHAATSDAGIYSCRATNVIDGEERVDEKQFYVTIPPNIVDKNATTIDLGVIKISCLVESFPAPKISWTLERDAATITTINDTFGLFSLSDQALGNHRYEYMLLVSLSDWLGEARIGCTAETRFSSASEYLKLNEWMRGYNGIVYTFTNPHEKMTRDQADVHCKRMHSEICRVHDVATQKILSESSKTLQSSSSVHIDGRAHALNGSRVWLWSDGDMIYNETKYGRWTGTYGRYLDDIYAGWSSGKPNDNGDCLILARNGGRYWSNVACETRLPAICQRRMQRAPVLHYAKAGSCSSTILISWEASRKAVGIRHRIDVRPINNGAGKYQGPIDVVATTDRYEHLIENMSLSTTYEIRIYPCPKYCLKEAGIVRYVTTGADITTLINQVNVSKITGAQACAISWTDNRLRKGITGYQITAMSSLAHAVSYKWLNFKERTEHDVKSDHDSTFMQIGKPNRNYTFFIRTKTCSGYGRPTYADGACIMERSAPSYVPALTQSSTTGITTNGTMELDLPNLDESNGPISCIFIIVDRTSDYESMRRITFGPEELQSASILQHKSSKTVYISLALSTEVIHAIDANDSVNHVLIIGDNDTSSCDASRISSDNSRRKRSSDINNVYNGYNEPLDKSKSYGVFVVTATPMDDGSIAYKSSDPVRIGRVEQYNSSSKAWVAGLVVGLLAVVLLLLALLIIRRKQVSRVKLVDKPIELQANSTGEGYSFNSTNQNVNKSIKVQRSDTDIPLSRLEETYKALAANENAGFTNHCKKLNAASEGILFPQEIASNPNIQNKNRYKDIIPFDKNVVRLTGDKKESYINASFIEGFSQGSKFISTQGPLRATVNDFWRLVTEQQCHTIVMLAKCVEKGEEKCAQYWPDQGRTHTYGRISVHNESETKKCGYIVRLFKVARQEVTAITVHHFQFVHWPDEGVPIATTEFMGMQRAVSHRLEKLGSTVPTVVHCSDGAGRTGVFIAFDHLWEGKEKLGRVDVYTCVYNLLRQRVQMVQNRRGKLLEADLKGVFESYTVGAFTM